MNLLLLSSVIHELSELIVGARVDRVYEGPGNALVVLLTRARKRFTLLLSPDRSLPRLHLVTEKPVASPAPNGFSLYLRSHASGAVITKVAQLNQDRIAEIIFSRQGEQFHLVFELMGSAANIIVTDASLKILAVYYSVPLGDRVKRPLIPGIQYTLPEKISTRAHPACASEEAPDKDRCASTAANREAERVYERLIEGRSVDTIRNGLRSLVNKASAKIGRKIKALSSDLESAKRAEEYKQTGALILANLHLLGKGKEEASLTGYDGETVSVRLDPKRSPGRNAELYFKKYKKAKSGRDVISKLLRQAGEEDGRLSSFLSRIDQAEEPGALADVRADLVASGYLFEKGGKENKKNPGLLPASFRRIECNGWEILVGKSAAGNDYLTTKIARPRDLWLHAEGMPGSHVVVRNPDAKEMPPAVFARAASLAAFYSKGKGEGKVAVTYTLAGHVKKPRGAKPGLVTLTERKTIMAVPEAG